MSVVWNRVNSAMERTTVQITRTKTTVLANVLVGCINAKQSSDVTATLLV